MSPDEPFSRRSVSARILAQLDLAPDADEDAALAAIAKLQAAVLATRPRLAAELPYRVRFWRRRAGLKGFELAKKLGMSAASVSGWEHGRKVPDHDTLERVCFVCGIDLVVFWSPIPDDDQGDNGDEEPSGQAASG